MKRYADAAALVRGTIYALFYRLFRRNVRIRLPFLAHSWVRISGPGSVFIDRWCTVHFNSFEGLTIATLSADANVRIGKRCNLGGVTIRCTKHIEFEDWVLSANCLVQDSLFCTAPVPHRTGSDLDVPREVRIKAGAWLTAQTIVLSGSAIGEGSVLSLASVCYRFLVPAGHVAFGNPASGSLPVGALARILKKT